MYKRQNVTWSFVNNDAGINTTVTFQYYNDSDKVYENIVFTATRSVTIKELRVTLVVDEGHSRENATCGKVVQSDSLFGYGGFGYWLNNGESQNPTSTVVKLYALNEASDQNFAEGQTWNLTFHLQSFANSNGFDCTTDFTPKHTAWWKYFKNHYIRLYNTTNDFTVPFGVLDYINPDTRLLYSDYFNNRLTLLVDGDSGTTSTTKVYCGDKGAPKTVIGATSWSYDSATKIVTVNVLHSSEQTVILDWTVLTGRTADVSSTQNFTVGININNNTQPVLGAFVYLGYRLQTTSLDGKVSFAEVFAGTYTIQVICNGTVSYSSSLPVTKNVEYIIDLASPDVAPQEKVTDIIPVILPQLPTFPWWLLLVGAGILVVWYFTQKKTKHTYKRKRSKKHR